MKLVCPFMWIACAASALALTTPARAQVYKCQGADGRVEYSGKPCGSGPEQQLSIKGNRSASSAASAPAKPVGQVRPADGRSDKRAAAEPAGSPEPPELPMDLRPLGQTPLGPMFYDAASIVRTGQMVSIRFVVSPIASPDSTLPNGRVAGSAALDFEYDCQARRVRQRAGRLHAGPGLTGEVVQREPAGNWTPIDWTGAQSLPGVYAVTCGAAR